MRKLIFKIEVTLDGFIGGPNGEMDWGSASVSTKEHWKDVLGIILAVPTIAVAKVFLKFLRELYTGSYFYHAGDITAAEAPSLVLEERLADAAETVLAEQIGSDSGDELLAAG